MPTICRPDQPSLTIRIDHSFTVKDRVSSHTSNERK